MNTLKMGVLGCSGHYFKRIAVPLHESLLVEPYAIASRDAEKAAAAGKKWGFSVAYASYEELLADPEVDFVYNPLPNHLHLEWIKKAADAGKPILCEKPLALNAQEALEAARYCRDKKVPLMEAFMYRFHPQWQRAKALAEAGEIGNLMVTHCVFGYNNKDPDNIRNIKAYGGGALLDIGCYAVSSARFLMGCEPEQVFCMIQEDPLFQTDTLVSGILDFGSGRRSTFTVGTQLFSIQRVDVYGSGGSMSIEVPFNMFGDIPGRLHIATDVAKRVVKTDIADQYLLEFDAFAQSLVDSVPLPVSIEDALSNMAVLDALRQSAQENNWVSVGKFNL